MIRISTLFKQPGEALLHVIADLDSVQSVNGLVSASRGLVTGSELLGVDASVADGRITLQLTGGSDGEQYLVTLFAEIGDGNTHEVELEVDVIDGKWTMPDGGASMLSVTEFVGRFGHEEILRLTDNGDGRIDRKMVIAALTDAQALAEAHLPPDRYTLPLDPVPTLIALIIADIALERLYKDEVPERIAASAKVALRNLERVLSGAISLGADHSGSKSSADPVLVHKGYNAYPDKLQGY